MRFVLVLLASVLVAPAAAPATKRCKDDKRARCGSVRVPLCAVRRTGAAASCACTSACFPTPIARGRRWPVVGAEGGPGYPSIDSADSYLFMLGSLRRRHDLIVMDNRGTGRSGVINCPRLQAGKGVYATEVGRCAARLGGRANAYGTGAATDDLAAVLGKLHVPRADIYGDSYGAYFAQAFAVRHPERARAVVLGAAFAVDGFDPWAREESAALRFAWPQLCLRSTGCGGDVLAELRRWAVELQEHPARRERSRDADGGRHRVEVDGSALGQIAGDASYYYTIYRDLSPPCAPTSAATARRCCGSPRKTCRSPGAAP